MPQPWGYAMRRYILTWSLLLALGPCSLARGQPVTVDMAKAKFTWLWSQGTGGVVESWRFTCAQVGQPAPIVKSVADPAARAALLTAVIASEGDYSCTLAALNGAGASPETAPVVFRAAKVPVAPTGLAVSP